MTARFYVASTGVIGERMPDDLLAQHLPQLAAGLGEPSQTAWQGAADAIRTTDTFSKAACSRVTVDGGTVPIVGIAKGSGMIAPDMATMLVFVFTDVLVPDDRHSRDMFQQCLATAADKSLNCITVDSDTSTSDTALLFATGASRVPLNDDSLVAFQQGLDAVLLDLAQQVVRDGEGASKFAEVCVQGAEDDNAARTIALAIGNSPLIKTMLAAEDANWGRVVMAVGKAGQKAARDKLAIWIAMSSVLSTARFAKATARRLPPRICGAMR